MRRMKTVEYFIRHGDVVNPDGVVYGRGLIPLSFEGRMQLKRLGEYLRDVGVNPKRIISSPMLRTRQSTHELYTVFPQALLAFSDALQEADPGQLVGKSLVRQRGKDFFSDPDFQDAGVERPEQIANRMMRVARTLANRYAGETILLVSHGHPISFGMYGLTHPGEPIPGIRTIEKDFDIKKGQAWKVVLDEEGIVMDYKYIRSDYSICVPQARFP